MALLIPILLPVLAGALLPLMRFGSKRLRNGFIEAVTLATSAAIAYLLCSGYARDVTGAVTDKLSFCLRMDSLSMVFTALIGFLWPVATLYAFSYMEHEEHEQRFFAYYLISYGVTAGVALAGNLFTLYIFYELLTLATLPLVLHKMDAASVHAGRQYLYYSISGAALAFVGMIFILSNGVGGTAFRFGGVLEDPQADRNILLTVYVLTFIGFGAKAALFPMHAWLPKVSVAPTPVTALLHAVAVVKAGAFAVLRATYYSFGADFLRGTWAQNVVLGMAAFTVVYGSAMALKEQHFKRRLAYSTVSNLSYILLGAALMTPEGMTGALLHLVCHALIKITLFFCAGAVLVRTGSEYIQDLRGYSKLMPKTMAVFLFAAAALCGVPPLPGFASKWVLASAAVGSGRVMGIVGAAALIISAILTAGYLLPVAVSAYFRPLSPENAAYSALHSGRRDPDWRMLLPLGILCVAIAALCFLAEPLRQLLATIANGIY